MRFKRLKRKALLTVVNRYKNWIVSFPARDRDDPTSIPFDEGVNQIISTGRLLALSHRDYEGDAYGILNEAIEGLKGDDDRPLVMKPGSDGLEYRSLIWVWRLASHGLNRFCGSFDETLRCLQDERSEMDLLDKNSKRWLAAYARHQEIFALNTLKDYAEHSYQQYAKRSAEIGRAHV